MSIPDNLNHQESVTNRLEKYAASLADAVVRVGGYFSMPDGAKEPVDGLVGEGLALPLTVLHDSLNRRAAFALDRIEASLAQLAVLTGERPDNGTSATLSGVSYREPDSYKSRPVGDRF